MTIEDKQKKLTPKQKVFVEKYLACWNAAEAARLAGYKGRANAVGSSIKSLPQVEKEIQARLDEMKLEANLVLALLSKQALANPSIFFEFDSNGKPTRDLNWDMVRGPEGRLIQKIKFTKEGPEIELYDAQNALIWLGKNHGLWIDRLDINAQTHLKGYMVVSPDDWDEPVKEITGH